MFDMISKFTGVPKYVIYIVIAVVFILATVSMFGSDYPVEVLAD